MTKQQQYMVLAKLLPEKVYWNLVDEALFWLKQPDRQMRGRVQESELLQLCQDARATLGEDYLKRVDFLNTLRGILADRLKRAISDFDLLQATVEENIIALAKVKGIKL